MYKRFSSLAAILLAGTVWAQQAPVQEESLSAEESAAVAAILAKHNSAQKHSAPTDAIVLSESTKQEALHAAKQETRQPDEETSADPEPNQEKTPAKCLPVAFIDIDIAFNEHPRTIAVKEQIRQKILAKEDEVQAARQRIELLSQENARLAGELLALKPFYERIVVEPTPLLPKIEEPADSLQFGNLLNHLTFSRAQVLSDTPLNTPKKREDITTYIAANKKEIAERSFFIDNYKYTTREEILTLEKKEVTEILQDIYTEIKSFAQKRNIGAVVRKDEILYGAKPVNVTKDFVNRLKKSKKYRPRGK